MTSVGNEPLVYHITYPTSLEETSSAKLASQYSLSSTSAEPVLGSFMFSNTP